MTSKKHQTGTDRIAEAALKLDFDIIVNIQGDEALVNPEHIDLVTNELIKDKSINIAILVNNFSKTNSESDIKVVVSKNYDVLYFSRSDIPYTSSGESSKFLKAYHIIPFRKEFLNEYASWPKGELEKIESNEYLRVLENGYTIKAVKVDSPAISVDTYEDLEYVRKKMLKDDIYQKYKN